MALLRRFRHLIYMDRSFFTVTSANQVIPELETRFRRLMLLRAELRTAYGTLRAGGLTPTWSTLAETKEIPATLQRPWGRFVAILMSMAEELEAIVQTGVEVKDVEQGICDFPTMRDGQVVLLCWKLGEPTVSHWHEEHAGFAGRQALDEESSFTETAPAGTRKGSPTASAA